MRESKKVISIISIAILVVCAYVLFYKPSNKVEVKAKEELNCYSEQCKADLEFVNNYYQKEREKIYKEASKPKKVKAQIYDKSGKQIGETECDQVFNEITCKNNTEKEGYLMLATTSMALDITELNMTFALWSAQSKIKDQYLKDNKCPFNLFCPTSSDEEIIHQLRENILSNNK